MERDQDIFCCRTGSERLVVWFGGINEPFMSEKLCTYASADLIAVKDRKFSWYTNGFSDDHQSYEDGLEALKREIALGEYKEIVFCGQSSGGYAALRYAIDCHPATVITFSPQTRNSFDGQNNMVPKVKLYDLGSIYKDVGNINLIFNMSRSESDHSDSFRWDDWWQVEKFKTHKRATFITHPFDNHSVSVRIREEMNLYRYVSGLISAYSEF